MERQAIAGAFASVSWRARKNVRPLYLGEFGAYRAADMPSRARWTDFVARTAAESLDSIEVVAEATGVEDPDPTQKRNAPGREQQQSRRPAGSALFDLIYGVGLLRPIDIFKDSEL